MDPIQILLSSADAAEAISQMKEVVQGMNQVGLSDWLSYAVALISALIGALITIVSVRITLRANQKQYHQDLINQSLPYFVVRQYKNKLKYLPLLIEAAKSFPGAQQPDQLEGLRDGKNFEEYLLDTVCMTQKKGKQTYTHDFSEAQWKMIESIGFYEKRESDGSFSFCYHRMMYLHLAFENVGEGSATLIRFDLKKKAAELRGIMIPAKKVGEEFHFRFLIEDCAPEDLGDYYLDIVYMDIYQRTYRQRYSLAIEKTADENYRIGFSFRTRQETFENYDEFSRRSENGD